jgi:preprotein translocase SecE subunit
MADTTAPTRPDGEAGRLASTTAFLTSTRAELRKVTWPTREELNKATRMVIVLSVVLGVTIGIIDFVLQKILVDGVAAIAR